VLQREDNSNAATKASGAGYVVQRAMREWGYECDVIAPSLIPRRSGVQRKHDKRDASELARLYRAGELIPVRIPSEAKERVGVVDDLQLAARKVTPMSSAKLRSRSSVNDTK
jgi:transposase